MTHIFISVPIKAARTSRCIQRNLSRRVTYLKICKYMSNCDV